MNLPFRLRPIVVLLSLLVGQGVLHAQTSQASSLSAQHRFGQTFLTWKEAAGITPPDAYRVYRSNKPIAKTADLTSAVLVAEVPKGSYWNTRANRPFTLAQGKPPLAKGMGFLVTTPVTGGIRYYAVLAVKQGRENRTIVSGAGGNVAGPVTELISMPKPVLQATTNGGKEKFFVHFATSRDRTGMPAQANREGRVFNYRIYMDPNAPGPRPVHVLLHAHSQDFRAYPLPTWADRNAIFIFFDDDNPPVTHSLWFGYHQQYGKGTPSGKVVDYTERRILWVLDLILADTTYNADRNRVYAFGASLGAMGALGLGFRHADRFAAVGGVVPAFGIVHKDFSLKSEVDKIFGTKTLNLFSSLGPRIYDLFDYTAQCANLAASGVAPMVFTAGRGDAVTGWSEKPAFFLASNRFRQPGTFYWDYRTHSVPGTWSAIEGRLFRELSRIRLDRPLPVFSNLDLSDDPGDGNRLKGDGIGSLNGYAYFNPRTVVETAAKITAEVGLKNDPSRRDYAMKTLGYADLTFRRLRTFTPKAGTYYLLRTTGLASNTVIEERILTTDANGLLTVPKVELSRTPRRLTIVPMNLTLPYNHIGGSRSVGGSLAVSLEAKGGQPAILTVGTRKGAISTPFGVWGILDPIIAWAGVTPKTGIVQLFMRVPSDPRLRGLTLLAQSMVGTKFAPLVSFKIR